MRRRSNLLVLLGLASFILGLVFVYIVTNDDDDDGASNDQTAQPDVVPVVVANEDLPAGASGDDILTTGRFRVEQVPIGERLPDAVVDPVQLQSASLTAPVAEGEQIQTSVLRALGGPRAEIPEGFEAVTVNVGFVAGGASTIQPGDRVNVFLAIPGPVTLNQVDDTGATAAVAGPYSTPRAELLLTNSLVLDVQLGTSSLQVGQPTQPATAGTASGGSLLVVLALDTLDAEKVIFASTATGSSLYLSRVRLDEELNPPPPVSGTPGQDFFTILAEEAGVAFQRSNG